jgi:hypothetical protein
MTSSDIIRWGGIAAMLGGVLWVAWSLLIRVSFEVLWEHRIVWCAMGGARVCPLIEEG